MNLVGRRKFAKIAGTVLAVAVAGAVSWALGMYPLPAGPATQTGPYPLRFTLSSPFASPPPVSASGVASEQAKPQVAGTAPVASSSPAALTVQTVPKNELGGLIPLRFQLGSSTGSARQSSSEPILIRKELLRNGVALGEVAVWIDPAGSIAIDSGDLARLLASSDKPLSEAIGQSGQDRTTFNSLRARGITIRYDPIADRVQINSAG